MHSLRWWHTVHITKNSRTSSEISTLTTESHHPPMHSLMVKQRDFVQTVKNSLTKAMEGGEDVI